MPSLWHPYNQERSGWYGCSVLDVKEHSQCIGRKSVMEEVIEVMESSKVLQVFEIEIKNRLFERQNLREKLMVIDGEIEGLRIAQSRVDACRGYAVSKSDLTKHEDKAG